MTLLYAAEYNVDHTTDAVSPELRDLLGRMTADNFKARPDLESVITLCEEQLCGQSSQEVCCGIAAIAGFGLPTEGNIFISTTFNLISALCIYFFNILYPILKQCRY